MSNKWLGMLLGIPHFEVAGWGGIYSHQPKSSRWWSLLAKGAPDSRVRHRIVSGAPPRHPAVRAWSRSTVGGFVLLWHRTVRCPSDFCSDILKSTVHFAESTVARREPLLRWHTGHYPVLHQTVRWIIAEVRLGNPKVKSLSWFTLVHRILSGGTPDCPVRQTRAHFGFLFAPFFWSLTCSFDWFVLNLWHLYNVWSRAN
jgi:hypothetical protein